MSVKNPTTYGDYYWAMQVEAEAEFDEQLERALSPYFARIIGEIPDKGDLPTSLQSFLQVLGEPPSAGFGALLKLTGAEFGAEILKDAVEPSMRMIKRSINRRAKETWLTSAQANLLLHRKKITSELWEAILESEGYEKVLHNVHYKSMQTYPTIPELVLYSRYMGDPENVWGTLEKFYDIDPVDFPVWDWLGRLRISTEQSQVLFKRGIIDGVSFYDELKRIGWQSYDIPAIEELAYVLPNPMLLIQGGLMRDANNEQLLKSISIGDIHPEYAQTYLDAVLTKPASIDIVNYELRQDNGLQNLDRQLTRIGIHPEFTNVYKTLAAQIPPVADIITMAVREAFTPDIAARFGQYEDFPNELAEWAGKKGLSKEWAERYWAAHWNLPSPQQGFEMLHRGVINVTELNMLLRALDVMPFWRDKLTAIAYRRLTRVDIRRMYKAGVLTEIEVYEAYQEHGYSDKNAERMTEFTIKQTLSSLSKFTSGDIVKAFAGRMIDRGTAISLLRDIGISAEDSSYIVSTAEYKRQWAFVDEQISGIRNLFKKRVYDENQARDNLAKLNLPADQINVLMQQWFYDKVEETDSTWTAAQTLKFLKRELITVDRAKRELNLIGYDTEHIKLYLQDLVWTPPSE